jgi:hypothetical protein
MIYILGKSNANCEYEELEEMIVMASSTIDKVLEYAYTKIPIHDLNDYEIFVNEDGGLRHESIYLENYAYDRFAKYPSNMFLENEDEYKYVCRQLRAFGDAIEEKKKKLKEESERKERERKEKQERELYEKLKAKYGD